MGIETTWFIISHSSCVWWCMRWRHRAGQSTVQQGTVQYRKVQCNTAEEELRWWTFRHEHLSSYREKKSQWILISPDDVFSSEEWGAVVMKRSWSWSLLFRKPCCGAMGGEYGQLLVFSPPSSLVQRTDSYVHCVPARMSNTVFTDEGKHMHTHSSHVLP